jgi:hypothetical protein
VLGYSSPTAFLVDQTKLSPGHAGRVIGYGNAEDKAPHAYAAWVDGRLSTDQAVHLFRAGEAVPDVYPDAEAALVDIVEGLDPVDTGKAVAYWRQAAEGPGEVATKTQQTRRGLHVSQTSGGMRRIDGWLTPTAGAALEAALDANTYTPTRPRPSQPPTTPPRRRVSNSARASGVSQGNSNLSEGQTTTGPPPPGGEKPHIVLHTDLQALQGLAGSLHETENGEIVDIDTLQMISCDCSITRIVFGPNSEVLDVGRKTRIWRPAQRKAITARDRHCQGPGCQAKPRHYDIHHQDHWADGGTTTIDKGNLYYRPRHTQQHLKNHQPQHRPPQT